MNSGNQCPMTMSHTWVCSLECTLRGAGLETQILIWDVNTMTHAAMASGHSAGRACQPEAGRATAEPHAQGANASQVLTGTKHQSTTGVLLIALVWLEMDGTGLDVVLPLTSAIYFTKRAPA